MGSEMCIRDRLNMETLLLSAGSSQSSQASEVHHDQRGVNLGAQRGNAGPGELGVNVDHAEIQRREASSTLATMHGCLRGFLGQVRSLPCTVTPTVRKPNK